MSNWRVRLQGSPQIVDVASAQKVLEGLRDGDWEPSDEVRGPADRDWRAIEDHPQFEDFVAEMAPPRVEPPDESRLDMNPLIDVSLVLLIFFILTTTYSSLRRAIDLPPEPPDKDSSGPVVVKADDLKDRTFEVKAWMERGQPTITINDQAVTLDELEVKVKDIVKNTGRKEMYVRVTDDVPWGVEAKLYDAAKAAQVTQIYWPKGR